MTRFPDTRSPNDDGLGNLKGGGPSMNVGEVVEQAWARCEDVEHPDLHEFIFTLEEGAVDMSSWLLGRHHKISNKSSKEDATTASAYALLCLLSRCFAPCRVP
jgi:hypothetical protein